MLSALAVTLSSCGRKREKVVRVYEHCSDINSNCENHYGIDPTEPVIVTVPPKVVIDIDFDIEVPVEDERGEPHEGRQCNERGHCKLKLHPGERARIGFDRDEQQHH